MKAILYIAKRLLLLIPVLLGVTLLTFFISHVIPIDPVAVALGPHATPEAISTLTKKWAIDRPLYIQYLIYIRNLLRGDLGTSMQSNRPVSKDLIAFFPATFELTTSSMILCLVFGIPLGIVAAVKNDRLIDHATRVFSLIGVSMPVFWLGLLLILLFYFKLGILPSGGRLSPLTQPPLRITGLYLLDSVLTANWAAFKDSFLHLILPSSTLGFAILGVISRIMRSSMLSILGEDFIRTAEAKGLKRFQVIGQHGLRNSILPVITVSGILYGRLLAGAVLTETIFAWPGMGLYAVKAILNLDFQPIMGFTILVAVIFVAVNLFVDMLYVLFDPRIRLG